MIPRRLAYRIWAAGLGSQVRRLRSLADDAAPDRRRGRHGDPARARGRRERADRLVAAADVLAAWIGGSGPPGGDLDPAIVGLVAAYIHGHTEAAAELRRRRADGARAVAPDPADLIDFVRWILESS